MKYLAAFFSALFGIIFFFMVMSYFELYFGLAEGIEIPVVFPGTYEYEEVKYQLLGQDLGTPLFAIVFLLLASWTFSVYHRLSKKKKPVWQEKAKSPLVLYLRSFVDDRVTRKSVALLTEFRSEEELLVGVLSDIAPVYAIGDPRDEQMPIGATRIYVDDAHWKETVTDMAQRAEVVVLRLGKTDSFWWEVEMALERIPIEKILFIVPASKTFSNVSTLYELLRGHNVNIRDVDVSVDKKQQGSISSFLFFDRNGRPTAVEVETPRFTRLFLSYENILRHALREFRAGFGLSSPRQHSVLWARVIQAVLILALLLMMFAQTFSDLSRLQNSTTGKVAESSILYGGANDAREVPACLGEDARASWLSEAQVGDWHPTKKRDRK